MFKWYANYSRSRPLFVRIWNSIDSSGPYHDRWSANQVIGDNNQRNTGVEILGLAVAYGAFSGWAKNFGKKESNIINDSVQGTANFLVFLVVAAVVVGLLDAVFRLPYFLIAYPKQTIAFFIDVLIITPAQTSWLEAIVYWILVPLLILNGLGLLEWLRPYM